MSLPIFETVSTANGDVNIYRAKSDHNGNSRYIIDYLTIPYPAYIRDESIGNENILGFRANQIEHIANTAKAIFGKRYRGKDYGGGIVFRASDPKQRVIDAVAEAMGRA